MQTGYPIVEIKPQRCTTASAAMAIGAEQAFAGSTGRLIGSMTIDKPMRYQMIPTAALAALYRFTMAIQIHGKAMHGIEGFEEGLHGGIVTAGAASVKTAD